MKFTKNMAISVMSCFLVAFMVLMMSGVALAQTETGRIGGIVTDPTGAVVPGATVTVKSLGTSATRTAETNSTGAYIITNLPPGNYELTVGAKGFASSKRQITITVGGITAQDVSLSVGAASTTVEVTGEAATQVNTESQMLSDVVTSKQVMEMPTLTRNPYDLIAISGNVAPDSASGRGAGYSINGQRSASTNILLDGSDNNDTFTATVGQSVPLDSVQEFSVVTSSFSAEYGRASGGVVNVATKSGTNAFHGTLYEFNRVSKLASNGYYNNAQGAARGVFTRNQFGYSVGGPVIKDKLFFFSNTEWFRIRSMSTNTVLVPTPQLIAAANANTRNFFSAYGSLKVPINGTVYTKSQISGLCSSSTPLCNALAASTPVWGTVNYPVPADAGGGSPRNEYQTVNRVDYNMSDRTTFYGRYALQSANYFAGTVGASPWTGYDTGQTIFNTNILASMTHTFSPRFVSQTKFVFNRLNNVQPLGVAAVGPTLYLSSANVASKILGLNVALPGYLPLTPGSAIPFGGPQNIGQLIEDLSYVKGNHQIRFGGQYIYLRDNRAFGAYQEAVEQLGTSLATGMEHFLAGTLTTFQAAVYPQGKFPGSTLTLPVGPPDFTRSNRYGDFAFYVQDNWRVRPRVTINLGLRWEYFGVQHNKDPNKDSNYYLGTGANLMQQIGTGHVYTVPNSPIGGLWAKDLNNFAPRLGFAWDMTGNGKMSLRGGWGISYERNFGNVTYNVIQNPPNYAVVSISASDVGGNLPVYINNAGPMAGNVGTKVLPAVTLRAVDENMKAAYAHFWSMALEREVAKNTMFSVEYTGSRGVGLYDIIGTNYLGSAQVFSGAAPGFSRSNPMYGNINYRTADGFSNYNAMVVSLKSANLFNQGLMFGANWTWSHAIDNQSNTFSESGNQYNLGVLDPTNPGLDRGNAQFDNRHRVAISGMWTPPYFKHLPGVGKAVLDGWTIAPIITMQTGNPFTVWDCWNGYNKCARMNLVAPGMAYKGSGNPAPVPGLPNQFYYIDLTSQLGGTGDNAYYNPKTGTADFGPYPANMTGRNIFTGPGTWNVDLGIYKEFRFKNERYGLQFRGEFYNLFNHANLYADSGSADISAVTYVPAYRDGRRNIQLALKFIF
jgi:hypothetical protein